MNYLIIDIGNTNIDFVNFNKLTNKYSNKFTVDTPDILKGHFGIVNKKIKKNFYKSALCSSVVPNAFNKLKKILKLKLEIFLLLMNFMRMILSPIKNGPNLASFV